MFDLKGRTVVITGASSGLGKAAVYAYAKAGAAVLITARRFERLEAIRGRTGSTGLQSRSSGM